MKTKNKIQWLPTLIIVWNLIDLVLHVAIDMAEPLRITGNFVGIAAALIVWFGIAKPYAPQVLAGSAIVVFVMKVIHSIVHGWLIPSFVFIGVSIFLLLL